jgi:hypothetical protein
MAQERTRESMSAINGSAAGAAHGLDSLDALPRSDPSPSPLPQGEGEFLLLPL